MLDNAGWSHELIIIPWFNFMQTWKCKGRDTRGSFARDKSNMMKGKTVNKEIKKTLHDSRTVPILLYAIRQGHEIKHRDM